MDFNEQALLKTLIYSSIFSYPLTEKELWKYAITQKELSKQQFTHIRSLLVSAQFIVQKQHLYCLKGEADTINVRLEREKFAQKKLLIAQKVSRQLAKIPFIKFIGISGSLAMDNTKEDDDIDFFIITQPKTVWLCRIIILCFLQLLGRRRKKHTTKVKNTICVNLLIESSHLRFFQSFENLYTAHEIVQIKPLINKNHTYENFLLANSWVEKFLPNAFEVKKYQSDSISEQKSNNFVTLLLCYFAPALNVIAKHLQLWYMKKHRSSEIITDSFLAFYPMDMSKKVLRKYEEGLKKYRISY